MDQMQARALVLAVTLGAAMASACGGDAGGAATSRYFPTTVGSSWTFNYTVRGQLKVQTATVTESTPDRLVRKTLDVGGVGYNLNIFQVAGGRQTLVRSESRKVEDDSLLASSTSAPGSIILPGDFTLG